MAIIYSQTAITFRLGGVVSAIDSGAGFGVLRILDGANTLITITLQKPCGVAALGVLTFSGFPINGTAVGSGSANGGQMESSDGTVMISGLTVGIPGSGANIIVVNGLNSTVVALGQTVTALSGQIIGS